MGIRNNLKGGTDWGEEALKPVTDLNQTFNSFYRKVYADNTGGSVSNSTTETDLATITIPQNKLGSNFSAMISTGYFLQEATTPGNYTLRIYIGGSAVKTIIQNLATGSGQESSGGGINYYATGLNSTAGDIIIKVTGQMSSATTSNKIVVTDLLVDCLYDNS